MLQIRIVIVVVAKEKLKESFFEIVNKGSLFFVSLFLSPLSFSCKSMTRMMTWQFFRTVLGIRSKEVASLFWLHFFFSSLSLFEKFWRNFCRASWGRFNENWKMFKNVYFNLYSSELFLLLSIEKYVETMSIEINFDLLNFSACSIIYKLVNFIE